MSFDFASHTRIRFGAGTLRELGDTARAYGNKALVVTGRNPARANAACQILGDAGVAAEVFSVPGEPTIADVTHAVERAKQAGCDHVIGFGGGSALDAAKAIAAMATNAGEVMDYLEVIGKGQPLKATPLPFIAVPTTAGTGSEVTHNAVLSSPEHKVKVSLRHPLMLARVALVDPELTLGLPPELTATTGMDALTQCIEAYVSCKANPLTDAFCVDGIRRAARSLQKAFNDENDLSARTDMALAGLYSGIALANAGLGAVHGFAGPIGGMFSAPHGAVCATLLPGVMEANYNALDDESPVKARFKEIAGILTQNPDATAEHGIRWLSELKTSLAIPKLSHWAITSADLPTIVTKASAASSMKGNPVQLGEEVLRAILEGAC